MDDVSIIKEKLDSVLLTDHNRAEGLKASEGNNQHPGR